MVAIMLRALAVAALLLPISKAAVNYCGAAMCGNSDAHTFCQFSEGPGPTCSGYIDDRLSGEEKGRLVARMNKRRSEVALGSLQQLPPASNMLKLRWVEELAREAQLWASQCRPPNDPEERDECRDLYAVTVGQCVASVVGEAPGLRPESMVDMWYLQGRQYKGSIMIHSRNTNDKKSPLDFAQMLWAETYLVGCGRSRFMIDFEGRSRTVTRLVCNFAPRGPLGPLWRPGTPASDCPPRSRPDLDLPGLCTYHHDAVFTYNDTNETVFKEQSLLDTILEMERNSSLDFLGSLDQIYLRKMIVSNMSQQSTNESNQQTEKSDVEETFKDKEFTVNVTNDSQNVIDEVIALMIANSSAERVTKKKFSTIGRPKSYNIEELNSSSTKDFKNGTTGPVETVKEEETYNDYEFDVNIEKNTPDYSTSDTENNDTISVTKPVGTGNATDSTSTAKSSTQNINPFETSYPSTREMSKGTLKTGVENETATPYVKNIMLKRLLELSEKAEQNPSDPETARELQEALLRMEQALEPPPTKVRRELRSNENGEGEDIPDARQYKQSPRNEEPTEKTKGQEFKEIGTPDSAPIMNILTKYAPFMKSYENMFRRNHGATTSVNLVLFVLCVVFNNIYLI